MSGSPISCDSENAGPSRWLDAERVRVIAKCWIAVALAIYAFDLLQQTKDGLSDGNGRPFGDDFVNYWSAAFLALHGRAAEIYDFAAFHAFEQQVTGPHIQYYHYSYPPVLLLLTAPLAVMPYVPALGIWLVASWAAFYRALKLTEYQGALLLSLAVPALFVNAVGGQNGAWTAAMLGGGLLLLDRRPVIAGVLFGLLVCKPQLGVMLPVALIAGQRWRAFFAAAVTGLGLVAASVIVFGPDLWSAYAAQAAVLRSVILEDGTGVWHRMLSVFVFARRLGLNVGAAYLVQAVAGLIAAAIVARSWWRDDPPEIRNALVLLGTCLATPYLQDYDFVMGAFVVVWLAAVAGPAGCARGTVLAARAGLLGLPLLAGIIGLKTGFAFGPLVIGAVFVLFARASFAQKPFQAKWAAGSREENA